MSARLVQVTVLNSSDHPIHWQDDGRSHGEWQDPWWPSKLKTLGKGEQGAFRLESAGIATGVDGWVKFRVDLPHIAGGDDRSEFFTLNFSRAYIGSFQKSISEDHQQHDGPTRFWVKDWGFTDIANMSSSPFEFIVGIPRMLVDAPVLLQNEAEAKHPAWFVEVQGIASDVIPLHGAQGGNGIIYGTNYANDLLWFRHDGWQDGTFQWAEGSPKKVGDQWGGIRNLFSGGDGIIYGLNDANDLLWFRHDGWQDGTFRWGEGSPKKVGNQWAGLRNLFSGGNGIIYGLNDANDLLWFRHDGWQDGTFRWAEGSPKKVGNQWVGIRNLFSGGDGIIYGLNDANDLLWFRHDGWQDGTFRWGEGSPKKVGNQWGGLRNLFSGGDGIIYGLNDANDLLWFRHDGWQDGTFRWADGAPKKVGNQWGGVHNLFS
jgi:hypothetical protein